MSVSFALGARCEYCSRPITDADAKAENWPECFVLCEPCDEQATARHIREMTEFAASYRCDTDADSDDDESV